MNKQKINLGDEVKDTITGFKGIAIARTTWITGCCRINVQPKGINKDGKLFEIESFDEPMLEIIKPKKPKKINRKTGGPRITILK